MCKHAALVGPFLKSDNSSLCGYCTLQVDMTKVNLDTIKPWVTRQITELLGFEDDVVIGYIFNQLEERVIMKFFFFGLLANFKVRLLCWSYGIS